MKRIVLALGGNALGQTPQEQIQLVKKKTAKSIVDLVEEGYEIVVGHGNGPQIGMINLAMDFLHLPMEPKRHICRFGMWRDVAGIYWIPLAAGNPV